MSSRPGTPSKKMFEGTDAVAQNRRVAVNRIVEIHDALELKQAADAAANAQPQDPTRSSTSSDTLSIGFDAIDLEDSEIRAFRYLVRKWDNTERPDPEFDQAVHSTEFNFDEAATRHFIRRVALWNESEEIMQAAKRGMEKRAKKEGKRARDSVLGKLWIKERLSQEHAVHDELKEVVTREGLAQLLYTLMHDYNEPLAPELVAECTIAVRMKYGITS